MKKTYYYTVVTESPSPSNTTNYVKAYSKKQIKDYYKSIYMGVWMILDPSDKPADGIIYVDITSFKQTQQ